MLQGKEMRAMISDKDTPRCEIVVLLELIICADDEGYVAATAQALADGLKYTPTMVARSLRNLVADGRLWKTNRQSVYQVPPHVALPKAHSARAGVPAMPPLAGAEAS